MVDIQKSDIQGKVAMPLNLDVSTTSKSGALYEN